MKAYLATTAVIFGLITLAHIARLFAEGGSVAREPIFDLLTILAAGMCVWAIRLIRKSQKK